MPRSSAYGGLGNALALADRSVGVDVDPQRRQAADLAPRVDGPQGLDAAVLGPSIQQDELATKTGTTRQCHGL